MHYETLEKDENTIYMGNVNDIRVFGDGEGGTFPGSRLVDEQEAESVGYELTVDGEEFETYPAGSTRPSVDADSSVSGWVIGVIDADATPELRINFDGTEETWTADD